MMHSFDMNDEGRPFRPDGSNDDGADHRSGRGRGRGSRGHRGGRGHGFGPGFGPGPGFPPAPGGRGPRGRRGGRDRGDVRTAILALLAEKPRHGYELIQEIGERSSGAWTPSPGSIYPNLQALEDEGLISIAQVDGRKTASLTDAGRSWVEENEAAIAAVFDSSTADEGVASLFAEMRAFAEAARQVARVGTPAQVAAATQALASARKSVYRLLSEDE